MQVALQNTAHTVVTIDPSQDPRYDAFVAGHERATAYHAGAWAKILGSTYGFKPAYLALLGEGDALEGAMPLMYTRGILSGRRMRSLPVVPTAGPLATSAAGEVALLEAACRVTDERASHLLVTTRAGGYEESVPGLETRRRNPTWISTMPPDADELRASWKKRSNNLFRSIKKSEAAGVTVREGTSEEDLRVFYGLYLATMKRHRSLPRPWRQMLLDQRLLGPSGVFKLFLAEHGGRVVAAATFHAYRDTVDLLYAGSDSSERDLRANFGLYWHAMRWAIETGHTRFDWGEAQEGGTLSRFKAQWSAEPVAEHTFDYASGAEEPGQTRADRIRNQHDTLDNQGVTSRRDEIVDKAWERIPIPLTRLAGEVVYRLF
ncbi:MAG TPA: GNAT family N-acetyltransferase [Thermoleophilaceae bacterium]|nr:GNAT family N-acetyltransferase [Thermoleophilaceae bacterium]